MKNTWLLMQLFRLSGLTSDYQLTCARRAHSILEGSGSGVEKLQKLLADGELRLFYNDDALLVSFIVTSLLLSHSYHPDVDAILSFIYDEGKRRQPAGSSEDPACFEKGFVHGCILGVLRAPVLFDEEPATNKCCFLGGTILNFLSRFLLLSFFGHAQRMDGMYSTMLSDLVARFVSTQDIAGMKYRQPLRAFLAALNSHVEQASHFPSELAEHVVNEFTQKMCSRILHPHERLRILVGCI